MTRKKQTPHPTRVSDRYTRALQIQIAEVRRQLRIAGGPRREAPDVVVAISVAAVFRRARALLAAERQGGE